MNFSPLLDKLLNGFIYWIVKRPNGSMKVYLWREPDEMVSWVVAEP